MRSATYWSSEMVLRKELLAGCGAAVRKLMSAGCPPSTLGCETPEKTVKSWRCCSRVTRWIQWRAVSARHSARKNSPANEGPDLLQMAEHYPARRGHGCRAEADTDHRVQERQQHQTDASTTQHELRREMEQPARCEYRLLFPHDNPLPFICLRKRSNLPAIPWTISRSP